MASQYVVMEKKNHSESVLLILGHGSSKHPDSSSSVRSHADMLGASNQYGEVRVAFLKEEPLVDDCLADLDGERLIIVPDFLAEGYFTRQVIPRKLSAFSAWGKAKYCPPVGTHPMMAELIEEAAIQQLGEWQRSETSLLVIGHGSGRNACSKQTLLHHLNEVAAGGGWAQVHDLWLEESPRVNSWRDVAQTRQVIVLPFLLNDGQHGGWDIPHDLGVSDEAPAHEITHHLGDFLMRLAPALGKSERFADAISAIAKIWG